MNTVICGAGEVGRHVAEVFGGQGGNVTIIDHSASSLAQVEDMMDVRTLQDGKRFSSRHVSGTQGGSNRIVLDGQFTFATAMSGPAR